MDFVVTSAALYFQPGEGALVAVGSADDHSEVGCSKRDMSKHFANPPKSRFMIPSLDTLLLEPGWLRGQEGVVLIGVHGSRKTLADDAVEICVPELAD